MLRKLILVGLALSAHPVALALGLGEIKLDSALNEPLSAEIPINITSRNELLGFEARVALNDTFARYGLDRPVFLNSLRFRVVNNAAGDPILKVTSTRAITEPFVTFLLEATWESGRLLREYTVLLDPPVFNEQAVAAPVNVAQSVSAQTSPRAGQVTPAPQPAPIPAPAPVYRQPAITGQTYGPVQRNQNLWNIAKSVQLNDVTINQMMVAIYRANPEAFMGNINLLKEGSTLQIPDADSVRNLLRSDANSVVVAHNADWRGGRVSTSGSRTASASTSDSGTRNTRLKLVAPESTEAGAGTAGGADLDEARRLLAQERAENAELSSELDAVREELEQAKRMINLKNADLAELQESLGKGTEVEAPVEMAVPELPSDEPAQVAEEATESGADATAEDETAEAVAQNDGGVPDPTSLLEDNKPAAEPKPFVIDATPAEPQESLVSKILGLLTKPLFLIGLAVLGILGTLLVMFRNRGDEVAEPWDAMANDDGDEVDLDLDSSLEKVAQETMAKDSTNISEREVEYFEDTGTFKPIDFDASETGQVPALGGDEAPFEDTLAGETGVKLDQADVLSEADFHMAYVLYDQAAELVGKASEGEPDRVDLKMKLLEIFFVWGNKDAFREAAAQSRDMLTAHAGEWDKIMIMGKQICPGDELFAGTASAPAVSDEVDLQLETASTDVGGLDFQAEDFGGADIFGEQSDDAAEALSVDDDVVDLDLGDALFASDDAPTATGDDSNVLDFNFEDNETRFNETATAVATSDDLLDDAPTSSTEAVKQQIESALEAKAGEDTEEMELDELGIDLDFGDITSVSEGTSGEFAVHDINAKSADDAEEEFDALFDGLGDDDDEPSALIDAEMIADPEPHDKLLDTSELKVEMEELLKGDTSGLMDRDETERGVESLIPDEDLLDVAASPMEETGSFSAEIRSLANDEIEIGEELAAASDALDFGFDDDDEETVLQETLVAPDAESEVAGTDDAESFTADSDEETVLATALMGDDSESVDLSEPFEDPSQETTAMPVFDPEEVNGEAVAAAETSDDTEAVTFHGIFDEPEGTQEMPVVDDFSDEVFPTPDGRTQEMKAMDLDVGETVDDSGDNTTMRVATSNLALPENAELAINEVGTKLDLARAYLDMGDPDGARGILEEVMQEGNDSQQADARALLDGIA